MALVPFSARGADRTKAPASRATVSDDPMPGNSAGGHDEGRERATNVGTPSRAVETGDGILRGNNMPGIVSGGRRLK